MTEGKASCLQRVSKAHMEKSECSVVLSGSRDRPKRVARCPCQGGWAFTVEVFEIRQQRTSGPSPSCSPRTSQSHTTREPAGCHSVPGTVLYHSFTHAHQTCLIAEASVILCWKQQCLISSVLGKTHQSSFPPPKSPQSYGQEHKKCKYDHLTHLIKNWG